MLQFKENINQNGIIKEYKLKDTIAGVTCRGVISKGWYIDEKGGTVLVKGNTENSYQPFSEVISSKILSILEIDHVGYWLEDVDKFPEIKIYNDIKHVSLCNKFEIPEESYTIPLSEYISRNIDCDIEDFDDNMCNIKTLLLENINMGKLKVMLVLDSYLANDDRHFQNIELLISGTQNILSKPFDFGSALCSTLNINSSSLRKEVNKCKPFFKKHINQVEWISKVSDYRINCKYTKEDFYKKVIDEIYPILNLLPQKRSMIITNLLYQRLDYLDYLIDWRN